MTWRVQGNDLEMISFCGGSLKHLLRVSKHLCSPLREFRKRFEKKVEMNKKKNRENLFLIHTWQVGRKKETKKKARKRTKQANTHRPQSPKTFSPFEPALLVSLFSFSVCSFFFSFLFQIGVEYIENERDFSFLFYILLLLNIIVRAMANDLKYRPSHI